MRDTTREKPVYLRIGDWHPSERSRNYGEGSTEAGVSVYDLATERSIVVPADGEWASADLAHRLKLGLPRHLVQGDWIGCGGDGEPLLQKIVRVGLWPDDLAEGFRSSMVDTEGETLVSVEEATGSPAVAAGSRFVARL